MTATVTSRPEKQTTGVAPVLEPRAYAALLAEGLRIATKFGRVEVNGPPPLREADNGVYSLAQWQSGFKNQNDRGTCWAFAGAAALEAAYRRKYNMLIDVSEEYVFHMGKSFALNRDAAGAAVQPVENNSSLIGFQGSGDIVQKISENASPPEDTAPYLQTQQALLDILPVLGFAGVNAVMSQEDYDAVEFCEQHIPLLARVNARYRATGWASLGANPSVTALENTIMADHEVICECTTPLGGHVLLLVGFDRNRQVFFRPRTAGAKASSSRSPMPTIPTGRSARAGTSPMSSIRHSCRTKRVGSGTGGRTWGTRPSGSSCGGPKISPTPARPPSWAPPTWVTGRMT